MLGKNKVFPCTRHEGVCREWTYSFTRSNLGSAQRCVINLAAQLLYQGGKNPLVPTEQRAGRIPERLWTF
jgi:hypothetical protein